ncbi:MAG: Uma2 family endonuclease [Chloroflexi bacterium]|nr:Uma2 family endonuclease [Chloroflexota bacterium]
MTTATAPLTTYPSLPADQTWPAQGHWTYEDFLRLPDDGVRYEIIDGVLTMTNAPDPEHQFAVVQATYAFETVVRARQLGVVYTAPIEVHLPGIAKPVQPDVLFVAQARRDIVKEKFIEGAPDLIVEVTSASTARLDRKVKLDAYERAGVREYWIVNPRTRFIEVYGLARGEYALLGEYGPGQRVVSQALPDLDLLTDNLFAAS